MYAVIETGGKQYRVEKGDALLVDRLSAKQGATVGLRAVAFSDKEMLIEPKALEKVKVEAKVAEHLRGPKLRIFKYKAKKGYRRRAGHRSELTRLEVTAISKGAGGSATATKPAAKKPAAKKPAAKPATKKEAGDGS
jgi:large subunit ribosomal protein L21